MKTTSGMRVQSESGGMMVLALIILMISIILLLSLLNIGIMEYRCSRFDADLRQAQQGVDAAVEWGLEAIYTELTLPAHLIIQELPHRLECSDDHLEFGPQGCRVSLGDIIKVAERGAEPNQCIYDLCVSAHYNGARRAAAIQVEFNFSGGYELILEDGSREFVPRVYLDRGQVSAYEYIYE